MKFPISATTKSRGIRVLAGSLLIFLFGCRIWYSAFPPALPRVRCVAADARTSVFVEGVFRYGGDILEPSRGSLSGTIRFRQNGDAVHVTHVTYDAGYHRAVTGRGRLTGNRLEVLLEAPRGGRAYSARVTFIFGPRGDDFCVAYKDTNGDAGAMGSFAGKRINWP